MPQLEGKFPPLVDRHYPVFCAVEYKSPADARRFPEVYEGFPEVVQVLLQEFYIHMLISFRLRQLRAIASFKEGIENGKGLMGELRAHGIVESPGSPFCRPIEGMKRVEPAEDNQQIRSLPKIAGTEVQPEGMDDHNPSRRIRGE